MTDDRQVLEAVRPADAPAVPAALDCPICGAEDTVHATGEAADQRVGRPAICLWCRSVLVV